MGRNQRFGALLGLASLFGASAAFGQAAEAGSTSGAGRLEQPRVVPQAVLG